MKPHYTLVENARVLSYENHSDRPCDLLLRNAEGEKPSEILAIEREIDRRSLPDCVLSTVKAAGALLLPPFSDLAVCLREPGSMYIEDIASSCRAALAGGFRELLCFYEPDSRYTDAEAIRYMAAFSNGRVALYPTAPAADRQGGQNGGLEECFSAGAAAVSDRFSPLSDEAALREAMRAATEKKRLYHAFCTLPSLAGKGEVNTSIAKMLGYRGIPASAEELAVIRNLLLAEETGCRLHLSGISTARSLSFIRRAKSEGLRVTCDVSPYHFFFEENAVLYHGGNAKLLPPLRGEADRQAVVEAIADGTIDAIASHHHPNGRGQGRALMADAPFGAVGLEVTFSACVDRLVRPGIIDLFRLSELLSGGPSAILAETGATRPPLPSRVRVGARADFNLVSLDCPVTFSESGLQGRAKNTPFLGMTLHGRVERVFIDGTELKIRK